MKEETLTTNISKLSKEKKSNLVDSLEAIKRNLRCDFTYTIINNVLRVTSVDFAITTVKNIVNHLKNGR